MYVGLTLFFIRAQIRFWGLMPTQCPRNAQHFGDGEI